MASDTATRTAPRPSASDRVLPEYEPLYHVVLLDDDEHTYDYVVRMLCSLFHYPAREAFAMAREVDTTGRVVVATTHRERAELKCEQIIGFGADPLILTSRGSMGAYIEPCA